MLRMYVVCIHTYIYIYICTRPLCFVCVFVWVFLLHIGCGVGGGLWGLGRGRRPAGAAQRPAGNREDQARRGSAGKNKAILGELLAKRSPFAFQREDNGSKVYKKRSFIC